MISFKAQQDFNVILDDKILDRVKNTKFLGVLIDENLTWKCHIDWISKTLSRNIGIIKGVLHPRPVFGLFMHFSQKVQNIGNK